MRAIPFITEKSPRCFIFNDGKMCDVYSILYSAKVDLQNGLYLSASDADYKNSTLPTMNEVVKMGLAIEGTCIEHQYDMYFPAEKTELTEQDFVNIIEEFKENGFNVTMKALIHNYTAWLYDEKSGYRDEENNYHLFSPCGCNPLSFRVSTLHPKCEWQTTYTC